VQAASPGRLHLPCLEVFSDLVQVTAYGLEPLLEVYHPLLCLVEQSPDPFQALLLLDDHIPAPGDLGVQPGALRVDLLDPTQLRFRVARAALADGQTPLAAAILRGLVSEELGFVTAEGLPLDLLTIERLVSLDLIDADARRDLGERLRREHLRWPTLLLEHVARRAAIEDSGLERIIAERASLEAAILRHGDRLRQVEATLDGEALLLRRSLPSGDLAVAAWLPLVLLGVTVGCASKY